MLKFATLVSPLLGFFLAQPTLASEFKRVHGKEILRVRELSSSQVQAFETSNPSGILT